jgi:Flp pilus assembly CpaE family ATPase
VHQIAVFTRDDRVVDMLRSSGLRASSIDEAELLRYTRATDAPQVLVVDVRDFDQLPSGLAAFRRQHSGAGVVLIASSFDPRLMLDAMRVGVTECVAEPLSANALDEAVRRVLTNVVPQPTGQVFAFIGAKGGVGTSTLAVNTAAVIGRDLEHSVLLIDLHTSQEIAALRNAARIADTLRQRYGPARVKVVVNRFHRDAVIAQEDVERVIGTDVKRLPSDYKVALDALNVGRPVVLDMESRLAKAFATFAKDLAGVVKERAVRPSGVLGRLAWRRA